MNSSFLLSVTTFIYGLAAFLYVMSWVFKRQGPGHMATWVILVGLIGNTTGIVLRWVESYQLGIGHAPLSNLYESLVFFAWCIALFYLVYLFDGLFVHNIATNAVIGIGWVDHDTAVFENINDPRDQALLGILLVNFDQH